MKLIPILPNKCWMSGRLVIQSIFQETALHSISTIGHLENVSNKNLEHINKKGKVKVTVLSTFNTFDISQKKVIQ